MNLASVRELLVAETTPEVVSLRAIGYAAACVMGVSLFRDIRDSEHSDDK